jgi:nitrous oxidase accessory protein
MRRITLAASLAALGCGGPGAPDPFAHGAHGNHAHGAEVVGRASPVVAAVGTFARVDVATNGDVRTLARAIELAAPGATIMIHPGTYHEHGVAIDKPVTIVGHDYPTIDGDGQEILVVTADDVTVRGLRLTNVATAFVKDAAALRVSNANGCVIENNRVDDAFFGIYLAQVNRCRVTGNVLHASKGTEALSGNGIHLWTSRVITIANNEVKGHRDGIYFEFVHESRIEGNLSEGNLRYGLHFMYSDGCRYERNTFRHNGSGVAVMYTKHVEMVGNTFENNWGAASYGLLLKEIGDSRLEHNRFTRNTTGLLADGANRLVATGNQFTDNGWAVKLDASTIEARFTDNDFVGNTFDVATNNREHTSSFSGNYWDDYSGYDLNRDGTGDVPYHPVRLFSLVVERHSPSIALLRSAFVTLLDAAERALPSLTPETLVDPKPRMHRVS